MNAVTAQEATKLPKLAGKEADPQDIIRQYLEGKKTEEIAATYGVTRQGLGHWLRTHAEAQWKESQVIAAAERKDKAEDIYEEIQSRLETADKEERERLTLLLSVAREKLKAAQWDLERIHRRIYGQDVPVDAAGRVSITLNLGGARATNAVQHGDSGGITIDAEKLSP